MALISASRPIRLAVEVNIYANLDTDSGKGLERARILPNTVTGSAAGPKSARDIEGYREEHETRGASSRPQYSSTDYRSIGHLSVTAFLSIYFLSPSVPY
jgi:hypothetical protein